MRTTSSQGARTALAAVLAVMAMITGLIPSLLTPSAILPAVAVSHRRPDKDDDDADADKDDADDQSDDAAKDDGDSDDGADDQVDEDKLPANVKALLARERADKDKLKGTLTKERKARRDAEKRAKGTDKADDDKSKGAEKADDKTDGLAAVTAKLRRSNLRAALGENGVAADRVKVALKLIDLDDVEYDADDEPTNLDDVLEQAFEAYPFLKADAAKRKAPDIDGGDKNSNGKAPRLTAEELEAAKDLGMTPEEYQKFKDPSVQMPLAKRGGK